MRFVIAGLACLVLLSCQPNKSATPSGPAPWVSLDDNLPVHASVLALAIDPRDPRALYAAVYDSTGLYASEDDAQTWQADNQGLDPGGVFALTFDGDTLLAGTAAGLYQRAPDAATWTRVESIPPVAVYAVSRAPDGALLAATDAQGIYKGEGKTWTRIRGLDNEILLSVLALPGAPPGSNAAGIGTDRIILAGTSGQGLYITRDGGATWSQVAAFGNAYVSLLAQDPRDPAAIYARTRGALMRSTDAGQTWETLGGGMQGETVNSLLFDPNHSRLLAATAAHGILIGEQNGAQWRAASLPLPAGQAVLALAARGTLVFAGTADGVFRSEDDGETWRPVGTGLGVPLLHGLALDPKGGTLWLASEDGLYQSRDGGSSWQPTGADALGAPVLAVALAPGDSQTMYVGTSHQGVYVSQDGGKTWIAAGGDLGGRASIPGLAVDPQDAQHVLARVLYERIYASADRGDSWRTVWSGMPQDTEVESIAIDPRDPARVYAGANLHLFFSDDHGQNWQARGLDGLTVFTVWVDPGDSNHLLAGTTDGLYRSEDGGATWTLGGIRGATVTALARDAHGYIYAGTEYQGIWISGDGAGTFTRLGAGLDDVGATSLAVDEGRGVIYALTTRGVFKLNLAPAQQGQY